MLLPGKREVRNCVAFETVELLRLKVMVFPCVCVSLCVCEGNQPCKLVSLPHRAANWVRSLPPLCPEALSFLCARKTAKIKRATDNKTKNVHYYFGLKIEIISVQNPRYPQKYSKTLSMIFFFFFYLSFQWSRCMFNLGLFVSFEVTNALMFNISINYTFLRTCFKKDFLQISLQKLAWRISSTERRDLRVDEIKITNLSLCFCSFFFDL